MEPVTLSCAELSTREINTALAALPDGACAMPRSLTRFMRLITEPRSAKSLNVTGSSI